MCLSSPLTRGSVPGSSSTRSCTESYLTGYVRLATRFTDEIFALLIVSIFVMDAIGDPFSDVGLLHYLNPDQ
jgi:hypothetical protein